jgi:carnitine O-acetyltransferase
MLQMALQLAYYRTKGSIDLMGESAHTRQFLHGRTEIVRAVSSDSVPYADVC